MAIYVFRASTAVLSVATLIWVLAVAGLAADAPAAIVRFDGAGFSPNSLSLQRGEIIELWNDTDQDFRLTVTAGLPPSFSTYSLFLPVIARDGDAPELRSSGSAAREDMRFPAHGTVQVAFDDAGPWTVALFGLDAAAIAIVVQEPEPTATPTPTPTVVPVVQREWLLHKTTDGGHPDGNEQQIIWLMNRARANPAAEGTWLATADHPDIADPRAYFNVDTGVLQAEFSGYPTRPPAAFDVRLYNAARAHSEDLIARDAQDHNNQFEQVDAAGFGCTHGRGNVFSYAYNSVYAHAAFNIDWGGGADGMQADRGHRQAIMALDGDYMNVGIAMVPENNPDTNVGPLVTTGNYCSALDSLPDHHNRFLVGTVWSDRNGNQLYDPGEGVGGVQVTPDRGEFYAITGAAGGYTIPIAEPGEYRVAFGAPIDQLATVTVNETSVLLDASPSTQVAQQTASPKITTDAGRPVPIPPATPFRFGGF